MALNKIVTTTNSNPNAPETEEDGFRAEAVRRLKVLKLFEKHAQNVEKPLKTNKVARKKYI
jgi:hypothetical protein